MAIYGTELNRLSNKHWFEAINIHAENDKMFFVKRSCRHWSDVKRAAESILRKFINLLGIASSGESPTIQIINSYLCIASRNKDGDFKIMQYMRNNQFIGLAWRDLPFFLSLDERAVLDEQRAILSNLLERYPVIAGEWLLGFEDYGLLRSPVKWSDERIIQFKAWNQQDHADFMTETVLPWYRKTARLHFPECDSEFVPSDKALTTAQIRGMARTSVTVENGHFALELETIGSGDHAFTIYGFMSDGKAYYVARVKFLSKQEFFKKRRRLIDRFILFLREKEWNLRHATDKPKIPFILKINP